MKASCTLLTLIMQQLRFQKVIFILHCLLCIYTVSLYLNCFVYGWIYVINMKLFMYIRYTVEVGKWEVVSSTGVFLHLLIPHNSSTKLSFLGLVFMAAGFFEGKIEGNLPSLKSGSFGVIQGSKSEKFSQFQQASIISYGQSISIIDHIPISFIM